MEDIPQVSVLISVYNGEPYITDTAKSILNQSFEDFEFVIVDDGSTDSTWEILSNLAAVDDRIILLRNGRNLKIPASLNRGLSVCRSPLIARADADDVCLPARLEKQVVFMQEHSKVGVLSTGLITTDEFGRPLLKREKPVEDKDIRFELLFYNCICNSSVVFRKELVMGSGGYDTGFHTSQDYDLWARLRHKTHFANLPEPLVYRRIHGGSVTQNRGTRGDVLSYRISQRLLSSYLSRNVDILSVAGLVSVYQYRKNLSPNLLRQGFHLSKKLLSHAKLNEDQETFTKFRKKFSECFLAQSRFQMSHSRLSLELICFALFLDPSKMLTLKTAKQVALAASPSKFHQGMRNLERKVNNLFGRSQTNVS